MSLMRQIAWLVLGVVLAALVGAVGLSTLSAQQLMRTQLETKNADNAQSLAMALSQQKGDAELIKLLVSAQFDTGAYEFVRWRGVNGETLFERAEPPKPLPEFGSTEDFPLVQALNQLKGQPVVASKTALERKAEAKPAE